MRYNSMVILSALAAASLNGATVGATDSVLPLIQDGGGWSTQVTIVNLSPRPASLIVTFMTPKGFNEPWRLTVKASVGKVTGSIVEVPLAPGAAAILETSGTPETLTRGFAEVVELGDRPFGAFATLTQKSGDRILQSVQIPLSPVHERRSVVPLNLAEGASPELIWISQTSSATLDLIFRNLAGEQVRREELTFDNAAQIFVNVRQRWPDLKDFRGSLQWTVTFPNADRYEARTLAGLSLLIREGQAWSVMSGMTLAADQATSSPY